MATAYGWNAEIGEAEALRELLAFNRRAMLQAGK